MRAGVCVCVCVCVCACACALCVGCFHSFFCVFSRLGASGTTEDLPNPSKIWTNTPFGNVSRFSRSRLFKGRLGELHLAWSRGRICGEYYDRALKMLSLIFRFWVHIFYKTDPVSYPLQQCYESENLKVLSASLDCSWQLSICRFDSEFERRCL